MVDHLDSEGNVSHRLYRQHTYLLEGVNVKDLSKLGRDLSKILIVDNVKENYLRQPENGIAIKSWYDDPSDQCLKFLKILLVEIGKVGGQDLRIHAPKINKKMRPFMQ